MEVTLSDSDVLIDYLNGREPSFAAVARLLRGEALRTSTVTRFEIFSGVRNVREREAADRLFLAMPPTLALSDDAAMAAAIINRVLRREGNPLPAPDIFIAGIAIAAGLPLLTRNVRHFNRVRGLVVITP